MLRRLASLLLLLVLFTTRINNVNIAASFDPDRMRLVDTNMSTKSFLVRGNVPLNAAGKFDARLVRDSIKRQFQQTKAVEKLIVVTLLNTRAKDEALVLGEIAVGMTKPSSNTVEWVHAPVAGSWLSLLPSWLPVVDGTGGAWDLSARLYALLDSDPNTAIYVHCMRGVDRTGLVAGIYAMRFQNKTLQEVQSLNWDVADRRLQFLEASSLTAASARLLSASGSERFDL